jgi:hypothetical protein
MLFLHLKINKIFIILWSITIPNFVSKLGCRTKFHKETFYLFKSYQGNRHTNEHVYITSFSFLIDWYSFSNYLMTFRPNQTLWLYRHRPVSETSFVISECTKRWLGYHSGRRGFIFAFYPLHNETKLKISSIQAISLLAPFPAVLTAVENEMK